MRGLLRFSHHELFNIERQGQNRTIVELKLAEWALIDNALNHVHNPFQGLNNFEGILERHKPSKKQ